MDARALEQLLADAVDGVAVALQGRGMLGADDDEHRALAVDVLAPGVDMLPRRTVVSRPTRGVAAVVVEVMRAFADITVTTLSLGGKARCT